MGKLISDYLNSNLLQLTLEYYSGKKQLKQAKRLGKKVCSMMLPHGIELVKASKCEVISLYRVGKFDVDRELRLVRLSKNLFGINSLVQSLSFFNRTIGSDYLENFAEKLLNGLFSNYKNYVEIAANELYPLDACFGTRLYYGATVNWKNYIDFSFGTGIRCIWYSKHYELIKNIKPIIFIDIPTTSDKISQDYFLEEINSTINKLETIMESSISELDILREIKITNKIKKEYLKLIDIWIKNPNIISKISFVYLLSMIHFGFTDHIGNSEKFLKLLKDINENLKNSSKKVLDEVNSPKIMLSPMFGGFETQLMKIVSEFEGRLLFIDWETLGILNEIKENGNVLENYSNYLLNFSDIFINNTTLTKKWIEIILKYKIDGVIFNSVYGCKALTPASRIIKEELQKINIPMLDLSFQNLDENIGQLKTRIGAFTEILNN
ncbi:MAG: 2-hydroxyacyl-CoA dehydratase [Candidatus Lokiarchaeota archaeon]|nr:2-hydroxyacyl-CoA dehydratase [Candidatus Lokiarchaeota archaeon]